MSQVDGFENPEMQRLQMFVYMIPVIGFFPALWTLYRRQGSPQQRAASRLAITLALCWLSGFVLLEVGSTTMESFTLPLLLTTSLWTTSYFIIGLGLMIRVWQRQSLWLPGIGHIAEGVVDKHLS